MEKQQRLIHFPISFFAMIMGLGGLTIASQKIEELLHNQQHLSMILVYTSIGLFTLFALIYLFKLIRYPKIVINEFNHPIRLHFFPTISISLLLFSIIFLPINRSLSEMFWIAGSAIHLLFTLTIISLWVHHKKFEINHMNPSWFIPAVGNIIVPVAGVQHGFVEISWLFFSVGLGFWIILLVLFFNRAIFHHPLPEKLTPTLFILIAPPAVGFIAYVKLGGELDSFARVLYYFGLFMFMLLAVQFRVFMKVKFYLSWWAYSFPMAAITIASILMYHQTQLPTFKTISIVLYLLLVLLIITLLIRTALGVMRREICVEEH